MSDFSGCNCKSVSPTGVRPGNRDLQSCAAGTNKNSGKHSQFLLNSVNSVKYRKMYNPLYPSIRVTCQLSCMGTGKAELYKV